MTVKRMSDPAKILLDHVRVIFDGEDAQNTNDTFKKMLQAHTPRSRIERLGRHEALYNLRDDLLSKLQDGNADFSMLELIAQAESKALYLDALPKVDRVNKWQDAVKKPRGSRLKELDNWLDKQPLEDLTAQELFERLPQSYEAENFDQVFYRDGDSICINTNNKYKEITMNGFSKRVTAARKRKNLFPISH